MNNIKMAELILKLKTQNSGTIFESLSIVINEDEFKQLEIKEKDYTDDKTIGDFILWDNAFIVEYDQTKIIFDNSDNNTYSVDFAHRLNDRMIGEISRQEAEKSIKEFLRTDEGIRFLENNPKMDENHLWVISIKYLGLCEYVDYKLPIDYELMSDCANLSYLGSTLDEYIKNKYKEISLKLKVNDELSEIFEF